MWIGLVALVIYLLIQFAAVRIPLRPFFTITSLLMAFISSLRSQVLVSRSFRRRAPPYTNAHLRLPHRLTSGIYPSGEPQPRKPSFSPSS